MDPDQFRALPSGGTMLDDNTELHVALADDRDAAAEAALFAGLVDSDRRSATTWPSCPRGRNRPARGSTWS